MNPSTNTPHILIVEDEPRLALLLAEYLEQAGLSSSHLADGGPVVDWVREHSPALILLDLMLPKKDGMTILALPLLLPGRYYSPTINNLNQRRLARYLAKVCGRFDIKDPVLWTFMPHSGPLFEALAARARVFHCASHFFSIRRHTEHKRDRKERP